MARLLPTNFPLGAEPIATYSFSELASGVGTIILYGFNTIDNAVTSYSMTSSSIYSNDKLTIDQSGGAADTKRLDINCDLVFNKPITLFGTFLAQVTWLSGHDTSANLQGVSYIKIRLRKWDGSSETELFANTKSDTLTTASGVADSKTTPIEIDVSSRTIIGTGDTLRITVEVWSTAPGVGNTTRCALLHDPANRTVTCAEDYVGGAAFLNDPETSQLKFYIPLYIGSG